MSDNTAKNPDPRPSLDEVVREGAENRIRRYEDRTNFVGNLNNGDLLAMSNDMLLNIFESRKVELVAANRKAIQAFYQTLPRKLMVTDGTSSWFPDSVFVNFKDRWLLIHEGLAIKSLENYHQAVKNELLARLSAGRRCMENVAQAKSRLKAKVEAEATAKKDISDTDVESS